MMKTRDFVCYETQGIKHVYYSSNDYVRYDYRRNIAAVYSEDSDRLHELVYLVLVSKVGELMEEIGFHRIHALGFSYQGKGVLFVSPMGGGKTTLGLSLLKSFPIRLVSDDTPLLDSQCKLHPFPLRIGVRVDAPIPFPVDRLDLRHFKRRQFEDKVLIDIDFFQGKIEKNSVRLYCLLIGKIPGSRKEKCSIRPANHLILLPVLLKNLVLGIGIAQVKEYFLKRSASDFCGKIAVVLQRLFLCLRIILKCRSFIVTLGNDSHNNASTVIDFLDGRSGGPYPDGG